MSARVIVIGLGAMGSAAAQHLAERGHYVLGFDQFMPPHTHGSSHGQTRIIRQSYWEDPRYVPLLLRAYELWRKLEADTGQPLMQLTGGLMIGPPEEDLVACCMESARQFDLPHEVLSRDEVMRRFPAFSLSEGSVALYEEAAGYLRPEACVRMQLQQAARAGAELHLDERVLDWQAAPGGGVTVRTSLGEYTADRLVITAGPWAAEVLRAMQLPLRVTRQVVCWIEPVARAELFHAERFPIFIQQPRGTQPALYGLPAIGPEYAGVKVALHGSHNVCTPETAAREIGAEEIEEIRAAAAETLPLLTGRLVRAETCLYTMTPDEHFVIDRHPEYPQVVLAAGFSGHGFKFANVVGEVLADMATDEALRFNLGLFSIDRLRRG